MTEIRKREDIEEQYKWDLGTLYKDDASWEEALGNLDTYIEKTASWSGKLSDAASVRGLLDDMFSLYTQVANIANYAFLRSSENTREAAGQSMVQRTSGAEAKAVTASAFWRPELLSLDDEKLKEIIGDPLCGPYRFLLEDLVRHKEHTLSAKEEQLLASFSESINASGRIAETLMDADMVYEDAVDSEGNRHPLNDSTFILLQSDLDRSLRISSFENFYAGYRQHINTYAAAYTGCVKGRTAEAKARSFASDREMSLHDDNIPLSVYDNLIETVHNRMDAMYRYVRLRKRLLKLDELHYYDLYAPLVQEEKAEYSYEDAQKLVLKAVAPLGEEYGSVVKGAFANRWIDVYPNEGKANGAYSAGTYTSNPYIMMNYTGTLDSISVIAHEMGHSMQSWYTNHNQPVHYSNYSIFVAEVASTVNENLLAEQLLKEETDPKKKLSILNQYLEGFKGTVYRQTMFAEFEREAHAMAERGESLDRESLCSLYETLVRRYFGEDLVMDEQVKYEWARIPHFYMPFYVYVYATGYCTACALSQMILNEGKEAADRYISFLKMGGSRYPIDELKEAGVDLTTTEPIEKAIDQFERVLDEAEKMADLLGL